MLDHIQSQEREQVRNDLVQDHQYDERSDDMEQGTVTEFFSQQPIEYNGRYT